MRRPFIFDVPLFLLFVYLVCAGIAFIYTASYPLALSLGDNNTVASYHFAYRQAIFALMGLGAMLIAMRIPLLAFQRRPVQYLVGGLTLAMLLAVLLIGSAKNGNRAWIDFGFFQFQPSELAKITLVLLTSAYLVQSPWAVKSWHTFVRGPVWLFAVPLLFVMAQGDIGTVLVMFAASLIILSMAGMPARMWGPPVLLLLALVAIGVTIGLQTGKGGQRVKRFQAWLNPYAKIAQSHQPRNSLIAIGSGGAFGRGWCASRQKWFYVPEPQNDYISAIIAEELGFLWMTLFLLLPYMVMIYLGFDIAIKSPSPFAAMVAAGCTAMLGIQALIHMAVVTNLIPCMGITLPFISYGGTSIIASMIMAGLILNVSGIKPETPVTDTAAQPAGVR